MLELSTLVLLSLPLSTRLQAIWMAPSRSCDTAVIAGNRRLPMESFYPHLIYTHATLTLILPSNAVPFESHNGSWLVFCINFPGSFLSAIGHLVVIITVLIHKVIRPSKGFARQ